MGAGPGNGQGRCRRRVDGPLDGLGQRQDPHGLAPQAGHAHHAVGVIQPQGQQREHVTEEAGGHQPACCQVALEGIAPHSEGAPGLVPEPGGEVTPTHHQQEAAARQHQQHHGGATGDAQPAIGEHTAVQHRDIQSQAAEQRIGIGRQVGEVLQGARRLDAEQRQQHRPVGVDQTDGQEGRRQDEHHRHQSRPQQRPEMQATATDAVRMVHMAQPEMNRGVIPVGHGQRHGQGHHPGNQFLHLGGEAVAGCPAAAQQPQPEVVQKERADQQAGRHQGQAHADPDQAGCQQIAPKIQRRATPAHQAQAGPPAGVQPQRTADAEERHQHRPPEDAHGAGDEEPQANDEGAHGQRLPARGPDAGQRRLLQVGQPMRADPGIGIQEQPATPTQPGPVQATGQHHAQQVGDPDAEIVVALAGKAHTDPADRNRRRPRGSVPAGLHGDVSGFGWASPARRPPAAPASRCDTALPAGGPARPLPGDWGPP